MSQVQDLLTSIYRFLTEYFMIISKPIGLAAALIINRL